MSKRTGTTSTTRGKRIAKKRSQSAVEDKNTPPKCIKFENIDDVFSHYTDLGEFCIGGKIELNENASKIFYKTSNGSIKCIDVLNISRKEIATLANNCSESPFGMRRQTVVDPNVRQAKELKANDFAFQFNPQMKSNIVCQIKKLLGTRDFVIEPYKLNIYPEGGHFKRHKDTIKNDKMIASLVICLPIPFEGGVLTVENKKKKSFNFDWGMPTADRNEIPWACFFCSCDHFISKVTKGNRITIAYDIFTDDSYQNIFDDDDDDDDPSNIPPLYREMRSKHLQNIIKELDVKTKYGYFPNHVYSFGDTDRDSKEVRFKLKGNDLLLYDMLNDQGWEVILQVYYPKIGSYGPFIEFHEIDDEGTNLDIDKINEYDKDRLQKLSTLKLLNTVDNCKEDVDPDEFDCEFTGNAPAVHSRSFYAGTIMILRHETRPESDQNTEKKKSA